MASRGLKVRNRPTFYHIQTNLACEQRTRSPEIILCRCTRCLQADPQGIRQPMWRKEDHDRTDAARASASATRGRGIQSQGRPSTRLSAAATRSRGRVLFSTGRAPRGSSQPTFLSIFNASLDRTHRDDTQELPSREGDAIIEGTEVNMLDGEPIAHMNLEHQSFEASQLLSE